MKTAASHRLVLSTLALALITAAAHAGDAPPQYQLVPIEVTGAQGVYVADINDAGLAVGYAVTAETYVDLPFLWTGSEAIALPIPADREMGYASGINADGLIVGYAALITENGAETTALLWNAADPTQYIEMDGPAGTQLNPEDIGADGTVVGLAATDGQFNAFTWTVDGGFVDDGVPPHGPGTQAWWSGINADGSKVGGWNFPGSVAHATIGRNGVPGITPIADGVDEVLSRANAINDAGIAVGEMDLDASGRSRPVTFVDGTASAIPGALLGLAAGSASDINADGTIVGRAQDFETFEFKAFVHVDGVSYDIAAQSGNGDLYDYLLNGVAVNASGAIAGTARGPDFTVASFVARPATGGADLSVAIDGPATYAPTATVPVAIQIDGAALASSTTRIRIDVRRDLVTLQAPEGWQCDALAGSRFAVDCTTSGNPAATTATFDVQIQAGGRMKVPAFTVAAGITGAGVDPVPGNNDATLRSRMSRETTVARVR